MRDKIAQGRRARQKGNEFMRRVANLLKPLYPNARRGLQSRDGSEFADVEGTPFWIECKDQKRPSLFGAHRQAAEAQEADDRPILLILKQFGNGTPYWCFQEPQALELLQAQADLRKFLALGYEVPR